LENRSILIRSIKINNTYHVHYINSHREMRGQINSKYINCKGEIKVGVRSGVGVGSGVGGNVDDTAGGTGVNLDKFLKNLLAGNAKKIPSTETTEHKWTSNGRS
jgi:hypothetical protein